MFYKITFRHDGEMAEWFQIEAKAKDAFKFMNMLINVHKLKRVDEDILVLDAGTVKLERLESFYWGA